MRTSARFIIAIAAASFLAAVSPKASAACAPLKSGFTYADLEATVLGCGATSVEDALKLLPKSYLENYVLVYSGRALQRAGKENPRAMMYGDDAKVVVTFNGHDSQIGYTDFEIMEFDPQTAEFSFRVLTFPGAGQPAKPSVKNPQRCLNCHGQNPRPIWDTHPLWPGVYGGDDESLFNGQYPVSTAEQEAYASYLENKKTHPRYSQLADPSSMPIAMFDRMLSKLNVKSIARELKRDTSLAPYRYAILGAVSCFAYGTLRVEQFVPESKRTTWSLDQGHVMADSIKQIATDFKTKIRRLSRLTTQGALSTRIQSIAKKSEADMAMELEDLDLLTNLRTLFGNIGDIEFSNFSTAVPTGAVFSDGTYTFRSSLESALVEEFLTIDDPQMAKMYSDRSLPMSRVTTTEICDALKTKSHEALR